jgi:hypothetical protein
MTPIFEIDFVFYSVSKTIGSDLWSPWSTIVAFLVYGLLEVPMLNLPPVIYIDSA